MPRLCPHPPSAHTAPPPSVCRACKEGLWHLVPGGPRCSQGLSCVPCGPPCSQGLSSVPGRGCHPSLAGAVLCPRQGLSSVPGGPPCWQGLSSVPGRGCPLSSAGAVVRPRRATVPAGAVLRLRPCILDCTQKHCGFCAFAVIDYLY